MPAVHEVSSKITVSVLGSASLLSIADMDGSQHETRCVHAPF